MSYPPIWTLIPSGSPNETAFFSRTMAATPRLFSLLTVAEASKLATPTRKYSPEEAVTGQMGWAKLCVVIVPDPWLASAGAHQRVARRSGDAGLC
jgi:hypothetical protein